jgi:hypothetical protein
MLDFHVERALEVDPREEKLPVWARDKLEMMRRATNESRKTLHDFMQGSEPGPFWLEPWSGVENQRRFYLPKNVGRLMFGDPNHPDEEFTISDGRGNSWGKDNHLTIVGRNGLSVLPNASNVIQLKTGDA